MDTATTEEKFLHAVELIKNLPKSGNFQPSNDMKLKFYSYFKQATEGPCDIPRPGFWDVVSRAKWDAWSRLGDMPKEVAMKNYVKEFVEILKATPFDETAHNYIHIMGPYIDFAPKEFREKHKHLNGTIGDVSSAPAYSTEDIENHKIGMPSKGWNNDHSNDSQKDAVSMNGHRFNGTADSDSDEFSDTYDNANSGSSDELISSPLIEPNNNPSLINLKESSVIRTRGGGEQRVVAGDGGSPMPGGRGNRSNRRGRSSGDFHPVHNPNNNSLGGGSGGRRNNNRSMEPSSDINEQLAFAVIRLQHTMEQVVSRLDSLEALLQAQNTNSCVSTVKSSFWSIFGIPPRAAVIILAWPLIVHWLIYIAVQKRRRR